MSGQWEVVSKKKEKTSKGSIQTNGKDIVKNKAQTLNVKIEDVLAKSQVKNLYSNKNNQNKNEEKKSQEVTTKKTIKKPEKTQEPLKPKPPKSIESALNSIDVEEFKGIYEKSKSKFPEAPIIWLKELAQYLNQKIPIDVQDPVFMNKPAKYPVVVVPSGIKDIIEKATKEANKSNCQLFFDISLASMTTDMAKSLPALGHKLFLQYIALNEPALVLANLNKHITLRNSYQNRPNIGLSILWAVGQVGLTDFQAGLRVFQELMLPLIEMKNYSRYIVKYLINLIKNSEHQNVLITKEEYLTLLDITYLGSKNFPSDLKQDLQISTPILKEALFAKNNDLGRLVDYFLRKININNNKSYQNCLVDVIVECFIRDMSTIQIWTKIYAKNVSSSTILLSYIENNWQKNLSEKLKLKQFKVGLSEVELVNNELLQRSRKEEGLLDSVDIVKRLSAKMVSEKKSGPSLKWLMFTVFLLVAGLVYYDIKGEGSWQDSRTKQSLEKMKVYEFTQITLAKSKEGISWLDQYIEEKFPGYQEVALEFSEPYLSFAKNVGIVIYNVGINIKETAVEKYPYIVKSIDAYVPGLLEQSQNAVVGAWTTSVHYFDKSIDYLKTEIFVGQLSPENMQRVVTDALNITQIKATEYYHWLYEKVKTAVK